MTLPSLSAALAALAASSASAYPNGAPNARLPTLGWSSWIALGPAGSAPIFDFCDEQSVKASADAFVSLGLYDAGYRHFHLDDASTRDYCERTSKRAQARARVRARGDAMTACDDGARCTAQRRCVRAAHDAAPLAAQV